MVEELKEQVFVEACQWDEDDAYVRARYKTPGGGVIDVSYFMKGELRDTVEVEIYGEKAQDFDNLEAYLVEELEGCLDWADVEAYWKEMSLDEWQAHGFRDAADYWHYRGV